MDPCEDLPPLNVLLERIPAANRHRLGNKLENTRSRVRIARSLRNWKTLARLLPGIKYDIDGIENDNRSLELQKIALLEKWVERNGPLATYRKLAECLYEAGAIESLQVLCKELGGDFQQRTTNTAVNPPQSLTQLASPTLLPSRSLPEPTKKELLNLVRVTRPYDLGIRLNVDESDLDIVRVNHPTDHGRQLSDVFSLYLRQTVRSSWLQVVAALQAMGERSQAQTIMDKFGIYEATSSQSQQAHPAVEVRSPLHSPPSSQQGHDPVLPQPQTAPPDPQVFVVEGGAHTEPPPNPQPPAPPEARPALRSPEQLGSQVPSLHPPPPNTSPTLTHRGAKGNSGQNTNDHFPPPPPSGGSRSRIHWTVYLCVLIIILLLTYIMFVK